MSRLTSSLRNPELITIIGLIIFSIIALSFVIKFGRTEANLWFNGGL